MSSDGARAHLAKGEALLAVKRYDQALIELGHAIAADPGEPLGYLLRCDTLLQMHRSGDAVEAASQALALVPESDWALRVRALALFNASRFAEAEVDARAAVRLSPQSASSWNCLATVLSGARQLTGAAEAADRAIALDPTDPHLYRRAARIAALLGTDAEPYLQAAVRLDPTHAPSLFLLADAVKRRGQYDEAIRHLRAAIQIDPAVPQYGASLKRLLALAEVRKRTDEARANGAVIGPAYRGPVPTAPATPTTPATPGKRGGRWRRR